MKNKTREWDLAKKQFASVELRETEYQIEDFANQDEEGYGLASSKGDLF